MNLLSLQAVQMSDVSQSINTLQITMLGGFITIVGVFVATMRWYIPKRFEQQTQEREARLEQFKADQETKRNSDNADTQRDLVLPQLVSGINSFASSNAQMTQNVSVLIQNRIEQDARMLGELHAHTLAVTGVTEGLEDLQGDFGRLKSRVEKLITDVQLNTAATQRSEVSSNVAAEQAQQTLQLVASFGQKLDTVAQVAKHDSRPIPTITADVTLHTAHTEPAADAGDGEKKIA